MEEYTPDAFANREDPLPLLTVTADDDGASSSEAEQRKRTSTRDVLRQALSASTIKEIAQDLGSEHAQRLESAGSLSLQDRLFSKYVLCSCSIPMDVLMKIYGRLLQQVIPAEDIDDMTEGAPTDRRSSKYVARPSFSLPLMTSNFRRFNAR